MGLTHCHWQMFLQTQSPHGSDLSESEESMYGKREGVLPGLVVMSNHPKNFYKQTRGFKNWHGDGHPDAGPCQHGESLNLTLGCMLFYEYECFTHCKCGD